MVYRQLQSAGWFCFAVLVSLSSCDTRQELFNGKDLTGWETYLGPRFNLEADEFDSTGAPGLNNDPDKVFSVVTEDGEPALRISGQHFGGISTTEEFSDYHLTLEFKWGKAKYAPKDSSARDSGLLYHAVGPHAGDGAFWMRSQEFQIQEGDCGDYWGVAGAAFDVPVKKAGESYVFDMVGPLTEFSERSATGRHAVKNPDAEKPSGEWNVVELYCVGATAVHVMNGKVNMVLYKSRQYGPDSVIVLNKGKIQIQSEGAEIFYRRIVLEETTSVPKELFVK